MRLAFDYLCSIDPLWSSCEVTEEGVIKALINSHKRLREQNIRRWKYFETLPFWKRWLLQKLFKTEELL